MKEQQAKLKREVQKEIDKQKAPKLVPPWQQNKSPASIHDTVKASCMPEMKKERITAVNNQCDARVETVEQQIQQTLEREQAQEQQRQEQIKNRPAERVFDKPAEEKSAKDGFNRAADPNDKKSMAAIAGRSPAG